MRTSRALRTLAAGVAAALLVAGCSGDDGGSDGGDTSQLTARLEAAQKHVTDAPALTISLRTSDLPDGITGLINAKGRGYQGETAGDAAFEGDVDVVSGGSAIKAEVVATGGTVYAKTDLAPVFLTIDPKTLGAPDPAGLLGAKGEGLPVILLETEKLSDEGKSRDGKDVLTTIQGTLPGDVVSTFLPSADPRGSFAVKYRLTDDDVLRDATISGPFYPGADDVTYVVQLAASDDDSTIEPPSKTRR